MRLVFAVASHLHMTAGEVEARMDSDELFMWANVLFGWGNVRGDDAEVLSVEDEIAAWR
jgi:hypothetical protein